MSHKAVRAVCVYNIPVEEHLTLGQFYWISPIPDYTDMVQVFDSNQMGVTHLDIQEFYSDRFDIIDEDPRGAK